MTKKEKGIRKLMEAKSRIQWNELDNLLEGLGFVLAPNQGGSSHCKFKHPKGAIISLCRPHPGNEVKPYILRQVRECLREWRLV